MKIKEFRIKNNYSQQEIAKLLNTSQSNYSKYERNEIEPDLKTLIRLADYFHTTIDSLLEHEVPYLIDKSQFTQTQLKIIEQIKTLQEDLCEKVVSYVTGLQEIAEERQKIINLYNKRS